MDKPRIPYTAVVVYGVLTLVVVNTLLIYMFLNNYKNNVLNEVSLNIGEYEEVDLTHICSMFSCEHISNGILYTNKNSHTKFSPWLVKDTAEYGDYHQSIIQLMKGVYLTNDKDIRVDIPQLNGFILVSIDVVFKDLSSLYYTILELFLIGNILFLMYNYVSHRRDQFKRNIMLHHDGYNKSMMMLTENIHHELNTPLAVINSKVLKLKGKISSVIDGSLTKEQCDVNDSAKDFEIVIASLTQISDLLNRMRPFKDVKKQNDRDLRTIIRTACDMVLVSQHESFNYEIFSALGNYRLDGKYMRNGELTAIMLNFIKNAIDANACNLNFRINTVENNTISIYIIDNGNGIPEHIQDDIFKENKSSKSSSRGTGLYVNKFMLDNAKGSVSLKQSNSSGTIFEVKLKVQEV